MEWYYLAWSEYRYRNVDLLWGNKGWGTIENMGSVPKKRCNWRNNEVNRGFMGKNEGELLNPRKVNEAQGCTDPSLSHHPSEQALPLFIT